MSLKTILQLAVATLAFGALGGCTFMKAITFEEDSRSGAKGERVQLYLVSGSKRPGKKSVDFRNLVSTSLSEDKQFVSAFAKCTGQDRARVLPALAAPLIGFIVDQGIEFITDRLASKVKQLQERSKSEYKARILIDAPQDFGTVPQCLILVRGKQGETGGNAQPGASGLVLVLEVSRRGGLGDAHSFSLIPTYLRADTAQAITGDGEPVSLSVAFVGRGARSEKGKNIVDVFGEASISFPNVSLGVSHDQLPGSTGLIPFPRKGVSAIEIVLGVVEHGTAVPDGEKAAAELKALKEALGPTIKSKIQELVPTEEN